MLAAVCRREDALLYRVVVEGLLGLLLVGASPSHGLAQEEGLPRKIANVKLGGSLEVFEPGEDQQSCDGAASFVGQIGLQVADYPWAVELAYSTNVGVDVFAGLFSPSFRWGQGWVAFSAGPVYRISMQSIPPDPDLGCEGGDVSKLLQGFGAGASVEYLLHRGYLGFFFEARQTFFELTATSINAGVSISPLLWLLYRNQ